MTDTAGAASRPRQTFRRITASSDPIDIANDREGPTLLLACTFTRFYNTGISLPVSLRGQGAVMDKFEEMGKRLDEELTRLRKYLEDEVAPVTEKRTAQFLREASEKLSEAARKLEARVAARTSQDSSETKS